MKTMECTHKVIKTTYEKFLESRNKDKYHCIMMVLMDSDVSVDDLEMQQDHFDYYASVPVAHWAVN